MTAVLCADTPAEAPATLPLMAPPMPPNVYAFTGAKGIAHGRPLDRSARHPLVDAIDGFAARLAGRDVVAPRRSRSWLDALPLRRAASASSMPDCRQRAR